MKVWIRISAYMIMFWWAFGSLWSHELEGRVVVAHPGFDDHQFVESYVYVFELNDYIELNVNGSFTIESPVSGRFSLKSFVPGFEPTYRTVFLPDQSEVTIPVSLQMVTLESFSIERQVPKYLERVRELIEPSRQEEQAPINLPVIPTEAQREPGIDLTKAFESLRNLFRRRRDENK